MLEPVFAIHSETATAYYHSMFINTNGISARRRYWLPMGNAGGEKGMKRGCRRSTDLWFASLDKTPIADSIAISPLLSTSLSLSWERHADKTATATKTPKSVLCGALSESLPKKADSATFKVECGMTVHRVDSRGPAEIRGPRRGRTRHWRGPGSAGSRPAGPRYAGKTRIPGQGPALRNSAVGGALAPHWAAHLPLRRFRRSGAGSRAVRRRYQSTGPGEESLLADLDRLPGGQTTIVNLIRQIAPVKHCLTEIQFLTEILSCRFADTQCFQPIPAVLYSITWVLVAFFNE